MKYIVHTKAGTVIQADFIEFKVARDPVTNEREYGPYVAIEGTQTALRGIVGPAHRGQWFAPWECLEPIEVVDDTGDVAIPDPFVSDPKPLPQPLACKALA